jgi:hypothetical protein
VPDEEDAGHQSVLSEIAAGGAELLTRVLDRPVHPEIERSFRAPEDRSAVLRCRVEGGDSSTPATVIVKAARGQGGTWYDPADRDPDGPRGRLLNEWAGLRFLQQLNVDPPFASRLFGGSIGRGLLVTEDLGEGLSLADLLQSDDSTQAERALFAYASALGRLHASTAGHSREYDAIRRALGQSGEATRPRAGERLAAIVPDFRAVCAALDLPLSSQCEVELERLEAAFTAPTPFEAFCIADCCPDNHRYMPGSAGARDEIRFFDLEFSGYQHALLEAAYLLLPFPTCWCVARLPDDLPFRLEAAYRTELAQGCPDADDDRTFFGAMAHACAAWLVITVGWSLPAIAGEDETWGISTVRQRIPLRAENTAAVIERSGDLLALGTLARDLAARVRERWGETVEIPLYPAFQAPSSGE